MRGRVYEVPLHGLVRASLFPLVAGKLQGHLEGFVQLSKLRSRQAADVVNKHRLGETHQFIAMHATVVLHPLVNTNGNLCGETIVGRVDRSTDHS